MYDSIQLCSFIQSCFMPQGNGVENSSARASNNPIEIELELSLLVDADGLIHYELDRHKKHKGRRKLGQNLVKIFEKVHFCIIHKLSTPGHFLSLELL